MVYLLSQGASLSILWLEDNNFRGIISSSMGQLSQLYSLDLSSNSLEGNIIEAHFSNLRNLHDFKIASNFLNSLSIRSWVHSFEEVTRLTLLSLSHNHINSDFPPFFCNMKSLEVLDLSNNHLIGDVPDCENKLFGKILTWIGRNHSSLKVLLLRSNLLYGVIPENIVKLTSLQVLDLSSNNLLGSLPSSLGNFSAMLLGLRFLNLSNNHLTGRIPEKMGDMKLLESLDLSVNSLTEEIPSSFSSMNFLTSLNLSYNNLSRKIPTSGQLSTFDSWTYVGNKDLCGAPLPTCPVCRTPPDARVKDDEQLERLLEYTSIVLGFVIGFWLFIGTLIMKQAIRCAFFRWIDKANN
ncbi:unnamed protein product [Musa acuminata subsp. malaccensis]|uniref:(wild Malaysian banana) hypothetical protein n=1 Tax=Musa acuminata subsp. malaccensis TaxID=214687 RepID=A0A804IHW3_MUSAM|nr:unnamed protein product [Musa acuminata subsp. malaccensis]